MTRWASSLPEVLEEREATNGKVGYIFTKDVLIDKGFINVYESDGTTVVGQFPIGQ